MTTRRTERDVISGTTWEVQQTPAGRYTILCWYSDGRNRTVDTCVIADDEVLMSAPEILSRRVWSVVTLMQRRMTAGVLNRALRP